ncbi:MAG: bifunctional demethylmenaquinone methyltransferase/2-methoxy-6-polyprenyl-1,4-benzoquinol methylase UbiE [Peptococcaceae bacterium]|nr:bifunctional demethylmenaquinone methyltransferase/2-methoxy-6-polyprenyl-1,4-benzoquinol methylase UbiE [Peptococcaceae bacterium]
MNGEKKVSYVHECFDAIAGKYDFMNVLMTWGMLGHWQKIVMEKSEMRPGDKGLDVCCGTGEMTYQLAKLAGPFGQAVGLDFSANMLETANAKRAEHPSLNVQFVEGDAMNLPFPDESFDAATNGFALRNVKDIPKVIQEMARVVEIGGKVVCIDVSRPTFPPARAFFDLYYFKIVPWLGNHLVSAEQISDGYTAYTWLAESLRTFPPPKELAQMFRDAGLTSVEIKPVGFGAATIISGIKTGTGHDFAPVADKVSANKVLIKGRRMIDHVIQRFTHK